MQGEGGIWRILEKPKTLLVLVLGFIFDYENENDDEDDLVSQTQNIL